MKEGAEATGQALVVCLEGDRSGSQPRNVWANVPMYKAPGLPDDSAKPDQEHVRSDFLPRRLDAAAALPVHMRTEVMRQPIADLEVGGFTSASASASAVTDAGRGQGEDMTRTTAN